MAHIYDHLDNLRRHNDRLRAENRRLRAALDSVLDHADMPAWVRLRCMTALDPTVVGTSPQTPVAQKILAAQVNAQEVERDS